MQDLDSEQVLFELTTIAGPRLLDDKTQESRKLGGIDERWARENLLQFVRDGLIPRIDRTHYPIIPSIPRPGKVARASRPARPYAAATRGPGGPRYSARLRVSRRALGRSSSRLTASTTPRAFLDPPFRKPGAFVKFFRDLGEAHRFAGIALGDVAAARERAAATCFSQYLTLTRGFAKCRHF